MDFGTGSGDVCEGNDSRLSDARSPIGTALVSGKLWVGNGSDLAAAVAMSGGATISDAGVVTLNNAPTATALQNPRLINGVSFDGTANIDILADSRSRRNILHNCEFYAFRGYIVGTMSTSQMTFDRWYFKKVGSGTATFSAGTAFPVPAIANDYLASQGVSLQTVSNQATTASGSAYVFSQAVEGYDAIHLSTSPFTVSFWSKASTTSKLTVAIDRGRTTGPIYTTSNTRRRIHGRNFRSPSLLTALARGQHIPEWGYGFRFVWGQEPHTNPQPLIAGSLAALCGLVSR